MRRAARRSTGQTAVRQKILKAGTLEAQETSLREWCSDKGWEVVGLYADKGISGKDIDHRPDMRRLVQDAENGCFDIVVFWALSRFTRSAGDLYKTMEKFEKCGVSLASFTETFDTSSPMGRAMIGIMGYLLRWSEKSQQNVSGRLWRYAQRKGC